MALRSHPLCLSVHFSPLERDRLVSKNSMKKRLKPCPQDIRDVPEEASNEMEFLFADRIEDVLRALIPQLSERLTPVPLAHAA